MTTASYPSDYKETEAREFNPETNSGIKLIQGSSKKKKAQSLNFKNESGIAAYMSYPIARTMQEKTGDTLRIKCVEYIPMDEGGPDDGFMGMKIKNSFITANYGNGREEILSNTKKNRDKVYKDTGQKIEKPEFNASFTDANTRMKNNVKSKYNIELPIPQELNDSNQVTWGDDRVNAIELAGLAIAQKFMEDGPADAIQKSQQAIRAMVSGMEFNDIGSQTTNAIRAAISGAAIGALGSNVSPQSVIARSTGQILNSNLELLFQGVNLRTFPFSVTFSPRSLEEAERVRLIIRYLKQTMSAKTGTGGGQGKIFLKSPDVFSLRYLHRGQDHPFLNSFKLCALTGMNVNYTNSGTYASYGDGTPVNIRLNMTFKELNPIYNEDYDSEGAGMGVGY